MMNGCLLHDETVVEFHPRNRRQQAKARCALMDNVIIYRGAPQLVASKIDAGRRITHSQTPGQ